MSFPLASLAPLALLAAALFALTRPGLRPRALPQVAEGAALVSLALTLAGAVQIWLIGPLTLSGGTGPLAPALALDAVGATMTVLVGFVGWTVLRHSRRYLDGAAREGAFHGLMLAALAAVMILVMAGGLATFAAASIATGIAVRALLLFNQGRAEARRAAVKFSLVWHAGDVALIAAAALLIAAFGAGDFAAITLAAGAGPLPGLALAATGLLAVAALLKTAAFPLHGWLTEVMEAPTPVSALLHAGIVNAGGLLLIRLADLMQASPGAMAGLVLAGGFTALFAGLVMLTQAAVKTALAWSTVAQMGFLMLQCGLGLWPLALLHIVAHSLYKAHGFLASGGAVRAVLAARRPGPVAAPGIGAVARAFALALALHAIVTAAVITAFGPMSAQALALGAILVFGVAYLVAQGLADAAPGALTRRTLLASGAATLSYFAFHALAGAVAGGSLPVPPTPGPLEWALIAVTLGSFGLVAVAQALFPHWAHHPAAAGLRVHVANGLYLNAAFDRLIAGALSKSR